MLQEGFLKLQQGGAFIAMHGLLIAVASLTAEQASVAVACGFSYPAACGIFLDQGSNPCPLHWQADSLPLDHQANPRPIFYMIGTIKLAAFPESSLRPLCVVCCSAVQTRYFHIVLFCTSLVLNLILTLKACWVSDV